jgi:hypothetical protein
MNRPARLAPLFVMVFATSLILATQATANIIASDRLVMASGDGTSSSGSSPQFDQDDFSGLGVFSSSAGISVDIPDVVGAADAIQNSFLSGSDISFYGSASTSGTVSASGAIGEFLSESSMSFQFEVGQTVDWWLSAAISATSFLGGSANVNLKILDSDNRTIFAMLVANSNSTFDVSGTFHPGVTYDMVVEVRSLTIVDDDYTTGGGEAIASFNMFIPEPGTGLLVSIGLAVLSMNRRHRV